MDDKPAKTLSGPEWFPRREERQHNVLLVALFKASIGAAVGLTFFMAGHRTLAMVVWGISAIVGLISISSEKGRAGLSRFFGFLSEWVGKILGTSLLTLIYFLVVTPVRVFNRLTNSDMLHLRDSDRRTFWLECDKDDRKRRHVSSMFATERLVAKRRRVTSFLMILALMVVAAELLLRAVGVGNPILYVDDPVVGFYPGPNQSVTRYGNRVRTNRFGMRSPDFTLRKPEGVFRTLMIGDSTLWGGSYMDQDDIYARLLEKHLNQQEGNGRVQVLNIGVNAWGPFHKLGYIERFGTFDADVAIICLPVGDIYRPFSGLAQLPYFPVRSPPRMALEEVFLKLVWRYRRRQIGKQPLRSWLMQGERGIQAYRKLAERLKEADCEVLVEILPSREAATSGRVDLEDSVARLRHVLEASGFPVGFPVGFAKDKGKRDDVYHDECHLHWRGHQLYADYLRDRILQRSGRFKEWRESLPLKMAEMGGRP